MGKSLRLCLLLLTAATTTACASGHSVKATSGRPNLAGQGSAVKPGPGGVVKVGNPYQVGDRWYYPADIPDYDETGTASWYGPQFHKKRTANGEIFDMNEVSAAHPILPMPSYVEVTNLNNGRQLVVRVNDRGPFAKERIIDLSRRAAQLLGFDAQGTAPVRVRRVYPDSNGKVTPPLPQTVIAQNTPQQLVPQAYGQPYGQQPYGTQAATAQPPQQPLYGQPAAQPPAPQYASAAPVGQGEASGAVTQTALPPSTYAQTPPTAAAAAAPARAGIVYIQVAALSDSQRADALATSLRRFGTSVVEPAPRGIYRVKVGPFESHQSAEIVLAEIRAAGYSDARVTLRPVS